MKLDKDELKVLKYCSEELIYIEKIPDLGLSEKKVKNILQKLERAGLVYSSKINEKLTAYQTTLEGDKLLKNVK